MVVDWDSSHVGDTQFGSKPLAKRVAVGGSVDHIGSKSPMM
jgi:hypothetical protein